MTIANLPAVRACRPAWNKGRIVGQKRPLLPKHVWAIGVRLEIAGSTRDVALFNLAIDSKLRGCELVKLKVADVYADGQARDRASIVQSKTQRPVRFEIAEGTRKSLEAWLSDPMMIGSEYLWPGRFHERLHIRRVSARVSSGTGFRRSGSNRARTARIRCGVRRLRRSTARPATSVRCSSCWGIRRWTARCATSASSSRMPSPSPSRSRSERQGRSRQGRPSDVYSRQPRWWG